MNIPEKYIYSPSKPFSYYNAVHGHGAIKAKKNHDNFTFVQFFTTAVS